jgi:two-component system, sensor histidine kinase and response regulator
MLRWKYSNLSLRTKVMIVTGAVITLSLSALATVGIFQMHSQLEAEEARRADSVALGVARAAELAITVRDTKELSRLTNSFLRDQSVLFIAVYGEGRAPIATAVRDHTAWEEFLRGGFADDRCVIGQRRVEASAQQDEFGLAELSNAPVAAPLAGRPRNIGRVIVGVSTEAARVALRSQNQVTLAATMASAVLGAAFLLIVLRSFLRRLERLAEASHAISRGDFSRVAVVDGDDEVGRLARSFDQMRSALAQRDRKLQEFTDTLQEQVKQRTSDLEQALAAAEQASRAKSMFLANMSHELRTPLNGVIGMVDLMLTANPSAQQRRYCEIAKTSARSLLDLINDVLDFSKIEAGKLELDSSEFDLHELIEGVATMFGDRAEKKKIELACAIGTNVPRMAGGDPTRLRQVLCNLVSNAIKFTESGTVVMNVALQSSSDAESSVKFSVKDSGIGIPEDRLNRLFQSFSQVDASTTRKFGGTGLGLAISKRIVELMGGRLEVQSREGEGSTFWFIVPLAHSSRPAKISASLEDLRGMRVLAVDDNATNREILQAQLASWQMQADLAGSAEQALRMFREAALAGRAYRFGVLDLYMPGTDGLQLAQQIKADPLICNTILISVSSISEQLLPGEMARHGFAACLTKPVLPSQFYNAMPESAGRRAAPTVEIDQPMPQLTGVRVLLAEDNEINQIVARGLLEQAGCICTVANNGREAVQQALAGEFDLILMDCQMPQMDGFEATKAIRQAEASFGGPIHRPIVALTANAIKGDREACLAAGMDEYVAKPIDPLELMRTIKSLVAIPDRAESSPSSLGSSSPSTNTPGEAWGAGLPNQRDQQISPSAPGNGNQSPPTSEQLKPPIDLPALQKRCMGNRKLAAKLLNTFESCAEGDIAALRANISSGDARATAATAHKIKGAAANISAERVRSIIAELEKLAKADALAQTRQFVEQLDNEMDRLREYLAIAAKQLAPSAPTTTQTDDGGAA